MATPPQIQLPVGIGERDGETERGEVGESEMEKGERRGESEMEMEKERARQTKVERRERGKKREFARPAGAGRDRRGNPKFQC